MIKNFLKEVVVITVGKPAENIAEILDSKKYINEFIIAKKLDITINQTRNILYKLSDFGLVSSMRKKDKKKGWYTYFWKIEQLKSMEFLKGILLKRIEHLENQMKSRSSKTFYICKRCNVEYNEESALSYDFTCNECGEIFTLSDSEKVLREFRRNLEKLKKEIEIIDSEIKKEKDRIGIQKEKEIKKESQKKLKEKEIKKSLNIKKKDILKKSLKKLTKKIEEKKIISKNSSSKNSVKKIKKKK